MNANAALALTLGASKVLKGKQEFLELLVTGLLAGGHVLLEDLPGLGKTTAAKTIAALLGLQFKRIQFTPDLLPYDITGVDVFDPETRSFRFMPGPVLTNIVLADEINRTTPKVQSALLEIMAEGQVTIGNVSHSPPQPFFVIATQNPIESEGTFPLPEAQLDRFMMRLSLGYPDRDAEMAILEENPQEGALRNLQPLFGADEFMAAKANAAKIFCHPAILGAIADIVRDTRSRREVTLGASPRAGLHYLAAARAFAMLKGRDFVNAEDIVALAPPVLAHRLKLKAQRPNVRSEAEQIVRDIALTRVEQLENLQQ